MSLGSIAHVQHYFARTGLLDGKGGQSGGKRRRVNGQNADEESSCEIATYDENTDPEALAGASMMGASMYDDEQVAASDVNNIMLPPTFSTYKHKPDLSQPPPDMTVLRTELSDALDSARKVLEDMARSDMPHTTQEDDSSTSQTQNQGWYELQGLHMLDIVTLAIRAAKNYYTCHSDTQRLYTLKSEREIRAELYQVLEVLKRIASRNFRGGTRPDEQRDILRWVESIDVLLKREDAQEKQEQEMMQQWTWLRGDWEGKERERERLFLSSFDPSDPPLPEWTAPISTSQTEGAESNAFLSSLRTGLRLIHLHNRLVARSRRKYGEIKIYHTDFTKPYRCAENLRYWIKAAELRWEVKLQVNALDVANLGGKDGRHDNDGRDDKDDKDVRTWVQFDAAVLAWCKAVRTELTAEWLGGRAA